MFFELCRQTIMKFSSSGDHNVSCRYIQREASGAAGDLV